MGATLNQVRRRGQVLLRSLAAAPDNKVLWSVSVSLALIFHVALIVFIFAVLRPVDNEIALDRSNEIKLEFDILTEEAVEIAKSLKNGDVVDDKSLFARSVETPTIISSEDRYLVESKPKVPASTTRLEGLALDSGKDTPPREGFHFEDSNASAQASANAPILAERGQNVKQTEQRIRRTWEKQLVVHLARHRSYLNIAADQNAQVTLMFVLDRGGHVMHTTVLKSSGEAVADQAALIMMQRADPVPPPPPSVAAKGLTFSLPIIFSVNKTRNRNLQKSN